MSSLVNYFALDRFIRVSCMSGSGYLVQLSPPQCSAHGRLLSRSQRTAGCPYIRTEDYDVIAIDGNINIVLRINENTRVKSREPWQT
jgi:hypothetical protein